MAAGSSPRRRWSRRARWLTVGLVVLVLAGIGTTGFVLARGATTPTTTYRTLTLAAETLKETVSATGTLEPARRADLGFDASGTVSDVDVKVGDTVAKGDELASIDDSELEVDLDAAKAELSEAKESLADVEDDDDATDTALTAAEATVAVKRSAVKQARSALADATLTAPFAGKVAAVGLDEGDSVGSSSGSSSSSSNSSSDDAVITIISADTFTVDTAVSVADVGSVKPGLQATITPTGATDPVYGTVSSVGVMASSSSASSSSGSGSSSTGSATFPVTVKVTGKQKSLLAGSTVTVAITVKQLTDVLSVPIVAVSNTDGKTTVQKLVNGNQVATEIVTGETIGAATVVKSGLAAGDQIVLATMTVRANNSGNSNGNQNGNSGGGGFGPPDGGGLPPGGGPPAGAGQGGNR